MPRPKKVLFLVPYPLQKAPSQRFRVEQFFPILNSESISFNVQSFYDSKTGAILYKKGAIIPKLTGLLKGFLKRIKLVLFQLKDYDFVFIHREASPLGPPLFEWYISKVRKKKIIFDYDDAIWINDSKSTLIRWVKATWKIKYIIKWSDKVAAGNEYLAAYARPFNSRVVILPTCVDIESAYNQIKAHNSNPVVVGWTGSHSTIPYLDTISDVLESISKESEILIICDTPPSFNFPNLRFVPWNKQSEIADLLKINIGIMPLVHDKWSEGKCGFKLIQYLSLGIPAIASPVGVNNKIIINGENGYLCTTRIEWENALRKLIKDPELREKMGKNGRQRVIEHYSVRANAGIFLELFN